jgi:type IV secretory pathway TraG/TraD family ATPase VirD4
VRDIERAETGVRGAFPVRLPVGKVLAVALVIGLVPVWWTVGKAVTPRIKSFYARTYWKTLADGLGVSRHGQPKMGVYRVLVVGELSAPLLATEQTLEAVPDQVREQSISLDSKRFHEWLRANVYGGSELSIYSLFVGLSFGSALLLCWAGAEYDWRRRNRALQGMHRRGTQFVSWRHFNRCELGPLWPLWWRASWRKQIRLRLLFGIQRGRRMGATGECYLNATEEWRESVMYVLRRACRRLKAGPWVYRRTLKSTRASMRVTVRLIRWLGCRWPSAEGPGVFFRIGRVARAVISEELLPYHFNIFGGTGRGKSSLIREILYQIEARGETAIVHDPKREFFREFYDASRGDVAFDPRLSLCPYWAIEEEAADEPEATPWASSFFPDEPRANPFFLKVPRAILAYLMSRYSVYNEPEKPATCARLGYWMANGEREILPRVKGTEHWRSLNKGGKNVAEMSDQSQGLFSTLGQLAKPLRMMPESPEGRQRFSVKGWAKKRQGWIFLCSEPVTQEAMTPLHSAIADMAILHTQAEVHDRELPRVWFVLDEVATMGPITQLESGTTKQRASGNPIVLGFHDLAQMEKRYGEKGAQTITGQAYTVITLGTGNEKEASHIERTIAHEEIDQMTENRPAHFLGHRARNQSIAVRDTAVVTAAQIQQLPRFEGYLLQEGRVIKIKLQRTRRRVRAEADERIIPPLVYREEPEQPEAPAPPLEVRMPELLSSVVCPVDDPAVAPYRKPCTNPLTRRRRKGGEKVEDICATRS